MGAPAAAQSLTGTSDKAPDRWTILERETKSLKRKGVRMPVIEYTAPDGSLRIKRGIVAGVDVSSKATIGVGLFDTRVRRNIQMSEPMASETKRKRKAAVGLTINF